MYVTHGLGLGSQVCPLYRVILDTDRDHLSQQTNTGATR